MTAVTVEKPLPNQGCTDHFGNISNLYSPNITRYRNIENYFFMWPWTLTHKLNLKLGQDDASS